MGDVIIVKTDSKLKSQAQKVASELGLSLSTVIKRYLETFVETKSISFGKKVSEDVTPYAMFSGVKIREEEIKKVKNSWEKNLK